MASEGREDDWQPVGEMSLNGRDYLKRLIFSHRYDRIRIKLKYMRKGPSGTNPQLIFHLEPNEFDEFVRLMFEAKHRAQRYMCATPGDCPLGPEPHAFVPDSGDISDGTLPCCRQPWEEDEAGPVIPAAPEGCDSMEFGGSPPSMVDGHCRCLVCGRCGHHTGNAHQGHYWKWCKVTQSMREFHFCCPDEEHGCELEATAKAEPYRRPCCDHCNNLAGDPDGHDYGDESAHDGPCGQCADEQARQEAIRDAE